MRKINPEQIPPLCSNCQTPMIISGSTGFKVWKCKNMIECRSVPIPYQEKKKSLPKKIKLPYKE